MGRALPPPSFGQNPKEQLLFFGKLFLTASFDFWEEIEIEGLRTEGEMSEAGIGEAAKQRRW